ncbi:MAG: NAD(P)-dependent oxidoreductase, partial [Candidatus Omnitrophica bacterium]|nr:NAD(P)-dependent oxidoreductase [Candidatus Omnitrophota bacterium]
THKVPEDEAEKIFKQMTRFIPKLPLIEQKMRMYVIKFVRTQGNVESPLEFINKEVMPLFPAIPNPAELGLPNDYFYPLTKLLAERMIRDLPNTMIVRFANIYGPKQAAYKVPTYIEEMNRAPHGSTYAVWAEGKRDYLYVNDCVKGLLRAATIPLVGKTKVINIASGRTTTNIQIAEQVKNALSRPDIKVTEDKTHKDKSAHICNNTIFQTMLLDNEPLTPLDQGIRETVAYYQGTRPAPERGEGKGHAFRPMGLGGEGGAYTILGIMSGLVMGINQCLTDYWSQHLVQWLSMTGAIVVIGVIVAIPYFIRAVLTTQAILKANPHLKELEAAWYDIGHDLEALTALHETAPGIFRDIITHETYSSHVRGLRPFIPLIKNVRKPDIILGVRKDTTKSEQKKILDAVNRVQAHAAEKIMVVFYQGSASETNDAETLSRFGTLAGAKMILPVQQDVKADVLAQTLEQTIIELFRLTHPAFKALEMDASRERLANLSYEQIKAMQRDLSLVLPAVTAENLASNSLYQMNMRMQSINSNFNTKYLLSGYAQDILDSDTSKSVVAVTVKSFGEIKVLADQHQSRMKSSAHPENHKLKIWLTVKTEAERRSTNAMKQNALRKMAIPSDVLSPDDVTVIVENAIAPSVIQNDLVQQGYKKDSIVVVDRKRDRSLESVGDARLIEYDCTVMPALYDAALELLAGTTENSAMKLVEHTLLGLKLTFYIFMPKIAPQDIQAIQREIDRYTQVLIAA